MGTAIRRSPFVYTVMISEIDVTYKAIDIVAFHARFLHNF